MPSINGDHRLVLAVLESLMSTDADFRELSVVNLLLEFRNQSTMILGFIALPIAIAKMNSRWQDSEVVLT